MTVGKALLRARQDRSMTQGALGRVAGLSASYVSRIENGRIEPTMRTVSRLARALEVSLADLFRLADAGPAATLHRCPVSGSGECIGEQIRSGRGRVPRGGRADYGPEQLRLLRLTDFVVRNGTREVRHALGVVLEGFVDRASARRRRRSRRSGNSRRTELEPRRRDSHRPGQRGDPRVGLLTWGPQTPWIRTVRRARA
jgi:transcriptional regulator with XRE-family HTH domain